MRSIFIKLTFIFLLGVILPMMVHHQISIHKISEANQKSVMQGNLEVAKTAARDVANYFQNGFSVLNNLEAQLEQLSLTPDKQDYLLKMTHANHPYFQFLKIMELDGKTVASSLFDDGITVDLSSHLPQLLKQKTVISDLYITKEPPPVRPALSLYLPILTNGKISRVLVAELNLVYAWHLVNQMRIGKEGEVFLVDAKGNVFASSNMSILFDLKPYPGFLKLIQTTQNQARSFLQKTDNGTEHLTSVAPLDLPFGGTLIVRQPTAEAFQLTKNLSTQMVVLTLFVLATMIGFGYFGVKKMVVSPAHALTAGLEKIATGDWTHRMTIDSRDEFATMGFHFNQMAEKLVGQANRIRLQERLSLIGKIAGGLIHDLKHPITNIRNWTRLMPAKASDPKFVTDFSSVVDREFTNVDRFFSNLKDLTSDMPFDPSRFNSGQILSELKTRFELETKDRQIKLVFSGDENLTIKADYFLLLRVLSNLISNAIQALSGEGQIEVSINAHADTAHDKILFAVSDTGRGIDANRLDSIFDDFTTTKRKGLGLGLAISKKIVELHKGNISVESKMQQGTRFTFWIPGATS